MERELKKAYIALAIVCIVWGTTYLAARISALHIPGIFISGVRQFTGGLLFVSYFKSKGCPWPNRDSLLQISTQGILMLCIGNGLSTWAVQYISSGLSAIIAALIPLFIALFSIIFLKTAKPSVQIFIGILIGFCGIAVIFYSHLHQLLDSKFFFGISLSLTATVCWALGTIYASKNKVPVNILFSVGLQMLIAGSCMLLICLLSGMYINLFHVDTKALVSLVYLIVFGSLITYPAYVFAISKLPATQVSIYAYINPVIAITLGWLLLHEHVTEHVLLGMCITLFGVYLVNKNFKK
ncbi:MAG: EamA family transporter [Flavisolibacter sp.]|nr:EamA family transporter [Flavisolibacter sp.]